MTDQPDLAALIASRICHDLISPLGAIGNGVELLAMERAGPELDLLSESVAHANARIRLFRISFGAAGADQRIARSEIAQILADLSRGGRVAFEWTSASDLPRREVRLACLLLHCLETALAYGGRVHVEEADESWTIRAEAPRLRADPDLWALVEGAPLPSGLAASQIQFALAARDLKSLGRKIAIDIGATGISLTF
ncbi:MAG: histidine phosphotransferase [Tabrizicola sp.]|nr:histidine phosphotransferase [Tabrizicola sp.]